MGKFGFGSKSGDGDDDSNRSGLFGRKKSSQSSQSTQNDNPYAQDTTNDPYAAPMTAYQRARVDVQAPRPGVGLPSGPRAGAGGPPPPYSTQQQQQPTGYGSDRYGTSGGYGSNRYNDNAAAFQANRQVPLGSGPATSSRGPGGYGGLGRTDSMNTTDEKRQDLFGAAPDRYAKREAEQAEQQSGTADGSYGDGYGASGGYGASDGYGASRELTAEEQEEAEVDAVKQQIRQVRDESLQSTQRSVQVGLAAQETMRSTLARLGVQGERLHNTERNLDVAATHNRRAEEKTKELKTLNRSMFAVHVGNPFTSKQRAAERDQKILDQHRFERDERESTRRAAFQSNQLMEDNFKELEQGQRRGHGVYKADPSASSKFAFEEDSDDERKEREIDDNMEQLSEIVGTLNVGGRAMAKTIDTHNVLIDRITAKSDAVDDHIRMNRTKLDRAVK